jgi:hypothetical protein
LNCDIVTERLERALDDANNMEQDINALILTLLSERGISCES